MKQLALSSIIIMTIAVFAVTGYAEIVDGVAAVVNSTVITEYQLQQTQEKFRQQNASEAALKRDSVLNFLIEEELVLQEAQNTGALITEAELQETMDDIKRQNNLISDEQLQEALAREGRILSEFTEDVRRQLQLSKVVAQEVRSKVEISEGEVDTYYQEHRDEFENASQEPGVLVRLILLALSEQADDDQVVQIQEKAAEIVRQLREGADFIEMARTHSQHTSAESGGEIGVFRPGEMAPPFDVALTLQPGEISDPVRAEKGFHIFTVQSAASDQVEEMAQIRSQIRNTLFDQKAEQLYTEWIAELKEKAYIEVK
jgi:peptidyl-prolyl cis-trans isomerase SurA